jgi:hypothetical protein
LARGNVQWTVPVGDPRRVFVCGGFDAWFGYANNTCGTVSVPRGPDNAIAPEPLSELVPLDVHLINPFQLCADGRVTGFETCDDGNTHRQNLKGSPALQARSLARLGREPIRCAGVEQQWAQEVSVAQSLPKGGVQAVLRLAEEGATVLGLAPGQYRRSRCGGSLQRTRQK